MTEEEWNTYITFPDWKIRCDIAYSEKTPLWVLEKLVYDEDVFTHYGLLKNPNITSKILDEMMNVALFRNYSSLPDVIVKHSKCSEQTSLKFYAYKKFKDHILNCHTQSSKNSDFGVS